MKNLFALFLLLPLLSKAVLPEIHHYTTDHYEGHSINYASIEDTSGIMYFANAYSVLEFDGTSWRSIPLFDHSPRCFTKDSKGQIFVGVNEDFGYLAKDNKGKTSFVSLRLLAPKEYQKPSIVYNAVFHRDKIYFSSAECVYIYDGKKVEVIVSEIGKDGVKSAFGYMGKVGDELYIYNDFRGLGRILEGKFQPLFMTKQENDDWVTGIIANDKGGIFIVQKNGFAQLKEGIFYPQKFKLNNNLMNIAATHVVSVDEGKIAVSTELNGVLICDFNGNVLDVLDKRIGLHNNFVNSTYLDKKGYLWAMLNNGIALIKWHAPFSYINEFQGVEGMGYSTALLHDTLFLGTSQGLYYTTQWPHNKNQTFKKIQEVGLIINDMKVFKGKLICSDQSDVYELNGLTPRKISTEEWMGGWTFKNVPGNDTLMICGTYEDLRIYAFRKGHWVFRNVLTGFKESCRMFEFDHKGVIWLVQGVAALYKIEPNNTFTKVVRYENYATKYKFPAGYFNDIIKVNNQLKISSDGGIYSLNANDQLQKDEQFSNFNFTIKRIRMVEGTTDQIYVIINERPAILELKNGKYIISEVLSANVRDKLVGSAEYVGKINSSDYLIATQLGFAIFNPISGTKISDFKCLIRQVRLLNVDNDSILLMGSTISLSHPYAYNSLAFYFSLPEYGVNSKVIYHTELSSNNNSFVWKDQSINAFKEYTNLPEGEYTFKVQGELNGKLYPAGIMTFSILPPWYRTKLAYLIYALIVFTIVVLITKGVQARFKKQREKLISEKAKEIQNKEAVHKNEMLELELQRKNDEMAFLALNFTQKKQFLSFLKTQLINISKNMNDDKSMAELKSLARSIGMEDKEEENWEKFQMHFDKTNDNFFQKLKQLDPKMNESTLLMCSYIRMNKSNKEIADLLSISISGVEKRKYRLKDKLGIKEDGSITDFISKL